MKSVFLMTLSVSALSSLALPAMAQDYYRPAELRPSYDTRPSYDEGAYLRPPLAVGVPVERYDEPRGAIVTTTRRVEQIPDEDGYGTTRTVVTTRRVVTPRDEPFGVLETGPVISRPLPPIRRVSKDPYDQPVLRQPIWGQQRLAQPVLGQPLLGQPVVGAPYLAAAPRLAPRRPMVVEERRVETTRRYVAPEALDDDE